jgi:hypothetical protein
MVRFCRTWSAALHQSLAVPETVVLGGSFEFGERGDAEILVELSVLLARRPGTVSIWRTPAGNLREETLQDDS